MLTAFATELNSTQSELETLLAKVDALRGQMKSLKAAQNKALKVVDNLKNLVSELPEMAIAELKKEILSLFPADCKPELQITTPEPAPATDLTLQTCVAHHPPEVFTNFVTEVPQTEVTTLKNTKNEEVNDCWNPAHFGDLHFNAEDNGQLNLLQPTTTEPPEPDDYPDLASFEAAWTEWKLEQEGEAEEELAHVCAKDFFNAIDLSSAIWEELKTALKPVRQPKQFLIMKGEVASLEEAIDDDQWPEVEPAPKTTDNDYAQTEYLNDTVCYIKKYDGEILAAYIGTASKKLAQEWADLLILWGCNAEARKAKRIGKGIRWEVKVTKISMEQLITAANNHPGLYSSVPMGNSEYTKKSMNGNAETSVNLGDSKTLQPQSSLQNENSKTSTKAEPINSSNDAEDEEIEKKLLDQLGLKLEEDNSDFTCPEWIVWWDNQRGERQAIGRIRKHLTRESNPWLHSDLSGLEITRGLGYPSKYAASRALLAKYQAKADTTDNKSDLFKPFFPASYKVKVGDRVKGIGSEFKKDIEGKIGTVQQVSGSGAIVNFEGLGVRWLANMNIEKVEETASIAS